MRESIKRYLPNIIRRCCPGDGELRRLIGNTGWQWADNLMRMAVGLVVGVWLARYLGPEQYGLYSYALAFVSIFAVAAALGLDDLIVRDAVSHPQQQRELLGSAAALRLLGGGVTLGGAVAAILVLRPGDRVSHELVAIIAAGALFQSVGVIEFWFHSQLQARLVVLGKCAAFMLTSLARVGLILAGAPLVAFAWVALAEVALGGVGLLAAYRHSGGRIGEWQVSPARIKGLLRDGWPLMAASMVITIYLRIDQVMLGELAGDGEVGIYAVAVRLAEVWYFVPAALYWSLFPGIAAARGNDEGLFFDRLQKFYNVAAAAGYLIALPTALLAHWLVPLLFGGDYAGSGTMLAVLIWGNLFSGLEMARSGFLTAMNWTRLYLVTASLGCLLNIALNWLLIPKFGGMGAAVASVVSYWFAAHGSCFLFKPLWKTGGMLTRAILWPKAW